MSYAPASDKDGRRKLDDAQGAILDAQLLAGELTRRQGASLNNIRTKYIDKIDKARNLEKQNQFFKPGELEALMASCISCSVCGHNFLPERLKEHEKLWPNKSCLKFKGKLLISK